LQKPDDQLVLLLSCAILLRFSARAVDAGGRSDRAAHRLSIPRNAAEAGHGVAIIQSVVPTHRYHVRVLRITQQGNPIREPLAVAWDKRRVLPRYTQEFCELLAAHMRALFPVPRPLVRKPDGRAMRVCGKRSARGR
jgi:DNA-binding transcriptional LysR family regulator